MEAQEATATGESCMRVDAIAKVTGRARYTDDYVMAGMCYAKYVRSPIAHGYAASINCDQAKNLPGVLVLTKTRCAGRADGGILTSKVGGIPVEVSISREEWNI